MQSPSLSRQDGPPYVLVKINKLGFFRIIDVKGDGNCFYNALAKSDYMRISCPNQLRQDTFDAIAQRKTEAENVFYDVCKEDCVFDDWIRKNRQQGVWGGSTVAAFICWIFGVNICIVTNGVRGFVLNDLRKWEGLSVGASSPAIYLYHHKFKAPLEPDEHCNHFAYLVPFHGNPDAFTGTIYTGSDTRRMGLTGDEPDKVIQPQNMNSTEHVAECNKQPPRKRTKMQSSTMIKQKNSKEMKQKKLMYFLGKMQVNKQHVQRVEAHRKSAEELDIELECCLSMERLISCLELEEATRNKNIFHKQVKQVKNEFDWMSRSVIIYFYLHPVLGKMDFARTAELFRISPRTLEGWVTKKEMKKRWSSIVKDLKFDDVVQAIPGSSIKQRLMDLQIDPKIKKLKEMPLNGSLKLLTKNSSSKSTHQALLAVAKDRKSLYVRVTDKRIHERQTRTRKYVEVQKFICEIVTTRWNMGMPIPKEDLRRLLLVEAKSENWEAWMDTYANGTFEAQKKLTVFLHRAIGKMGFSVRKTTVSQKIPEDWRRLSELGAKRVRERFRDADVDVVLAADETFIRFHETSGIVIAPQGEKRIGAAAQIDDKAGCTVLPTLDMTASRLLAPMVIFNGVFGATLMKKWQSYTDSLVMFTEKHWMTTETFILYVAWLMEHFKGKRIGLIIDYAPSHSNGDMDRWIDQLNKEHAVHNTKIFIEWIDKGLTSVYQPGDIAINKPLKDKIRESYHQHISGIASQNFRAGQRIKISRETLIGFIEEAFVFINKDQKRSKSIYKSFRMCGLNPWDDQMEHFTRHLDSLEDNKLYATLLKNQEALQLN